MEGVDKRKFSNIIIFTNKINFSDWRYISDGGF